MQRAPDDFKQKESILKCVPITYSNFEILTRIYFGHFVYIFHNMCNFVPTNS